MIKQPSILVCTDFSPFSDEALKAASILQKKTNGTLSVLHVSEHPVIWSWLPEGIPQTLDENVERELLGTLRKKLNSQLQRCEVQSESHISMGLPVQVIMEEIEAKKIDILVMGHKGKSDGQFRIGSLAEKVIAAAPIPVMVIKSAFHPGKIGALIDPSGEMETTLAWSESLAGQLGARHEVISLFPDLAARYIGIGKLGFSTELLTLNNEQQQEVIEKTKSKIRSYLKSETDIRVDISREKKLAYHLNTVMVEEHVDLAVMKRHQAGFLEKLMIGSETRRMLEIFNQNLFILPP